MSTYKIQIEALTEAQNSANAQEIAQSVKSLLEASQIGSQLTNVKIITELESALSDRVDAAEQDLYGERVAL